MLKKPTKRDAELLLKLTEVFNTPDMREAGKWFMSEYSAKDYKEFKSKYPPHGKEQMNVAMILSEYEMAGALISHGLLNEDLYFDTSGIELVWKRLEPIIAGWQKDTTPALWENAVWLAERHKKWRKNVWKPNLKWKMK